MTASALSFSAVTVTLSPCRAPSAYSGVEVPETFCSNRKLCWWAHVGNTDREGSCRQTHWSQCFPQASCRIWCWHRSGDLGWCVMQDHCCPHPVWQRGCTAPAWISDVGQMLRWVAAWAAAEISPSRGVSSPPCKKQLLVVLPSGPKRLIIHHGLQLLQNHWM